MYFSAVVCTWQDDDCEDVSIDVLFHPKGDRMANLMNIMRYCADDLQLYIYKIENVAPELMKETGRWD